MIRQGKAMLFGIALLPTLAATAAAAQATGEAPRPATPRRHRPRRPPRRPPLPRCRCRPAVDAGGFHVGFDFLFGAARGRSSGSLDKLQEYGTIDEGALLESLGVRYQRPGSADFLELRRGTRGRTTSRTGSTSGRRDRYRASALVRRDPAPLHRRVPPVLGLRQRAASASGTRCRRSSRRTTEMCAAATRGAACTPTRRCDDAAARDVRGLLEAANPVRFRARSPPRGRGRSSSTLSRDASAWARVRNEDRSGARVIGSGTYERFAQTPGGIHTGDRFIVTGRDLAEPLDYGTLGVSAGAGVHRDPGSADLEYSLTRFRNCDDVLLHDNPFRLTDAQATRFTVFGGGRTAASPRSATSGSPRTASRTSSPRRARSTFRMHGRLAASLSYGIVTQDQAFQPYTFNTASAPPTRPSRTRASWPARARCRSGPERRHPDARGDPLRERPPAPADDGLREVPRLPVRRPLGRDPVPGYAGYGDSVWRLERNDVSARPDAPVQNEVFDYWRHEADLGADYRISRMLSVGLEGGWEGWRYDRPPARRLDEYSVGASFALEADADRLAEGDVPVLGLHGRGVPARATAREPRGPGPHELQLGGLDAAPRGRARAVRPAPHVHRRRARPVRGGGLRRRDPGPGRAPRRIPVRPHGRQGHWRLRRRVGDPRRAGLVARQLLARLPQGEDGERGEGRGQQVDFIDPSTPPPRCATTSRP